MTPHDSDLILRRPKFAARTCVALAGGLGLLASFGWLARIGPGTRPFGLMGPTLAEGLSCWPRGIGSGCPGAGRGSAPGLPAPRLGLATLRLLEAAPGLRPTAGAWSTDWLLLNLPGRALGLATPVDGLSPLTDKEDHRAARR